MRNGYKFWAIFNTITCLASGLLAGYSFGYSVGFSTGITVKEESLKVRGISQECADEIQILVKQ